MATTAVTSEHLQSAGLAFVIACDDNKRRAFVTASWTTKAFKGKGRDGRATASIRRIGDEGVRC